MEERHRWSLGLGIAGLALMLLGLVDPLEGFVLILGGGMLTLIAARLADSGLTRSLAVGLGLAAVGCAAMLVLSSFGGIGGTSGLPPAWGLTIVPYPVGGFLMIAVAVRLIVRLHREGKGHPLPPAAHAGR